MPCTQPLRGWRSAKKNANGKRPIVFDIKKAHNDEHMQVPCGRCIGCRLDRSREWALRCVNEAQMHDKNMFITLTYSDENLPPLGSLSVPKYETRELPDGSYKKVQIESSDFQKFMKRLRQHEARQAKKENREIKEIKYYMAGEYGEFGGRPHYHSCIFGIRFNDLWPWRYSEGSNQTIYRSPTLEKLWKLGYSSVGDVTYESAAYTARYILKKQTGKKSLDQYCKIDQETGEILEEIAPEYNCMSRRNPIGKTWYEKYKGDLYPKDSYHIGKYTLKPPKYYDSLYELENPEEMNRIKNRRVLNRKEGEDDNERLEAKAKCIDARINLLKRGFEQ